MTYEEQVFADFDRQCILHYEVITNDYEALTTWAKSQPVSQNKALAFAFKHLKPTKKFNRKESSYQLKHHVEKLSDAMGEHEYCGNLEFIIAACQNGFKVTSVSDYNGSPNYYFNLDFDVDYIADQYDQGNRVAIRKQQARDQKNNHRQWIKEHKEYFKDVKVRRHLSSLYTFQEYNRVVPLSQADYRDVIKLKIMSDKFYDYADGLPPNGSWCINREMFIERFGCASRSFNELVFNDFTVQFIGNPVSKAYMHLPAHVTESDALHAIQKTLTFFLLNSPKALPEEFWE